MEENKFIQERLQELVKMAGNTDEAMELGENISKFISEGKNITKEMALSELNGSLELVELYQAAEKAKYMVDTLTQEYFDKYDTQNEKDKTLYIPYDFNKAKMMADIALDYAHECASTLESWVEIADEC